MVVSSEMARRMGLRALSAGLLAGSALVAPAALAQDGDTPVLRSQEVIVVTAQKREEDVLDVPINITAYSGQVLNDLGIEEFDQLAAFVPGLVVQEQSVNNPGFVIRGITSDSGAANIEPRVSVFQDGVSISRSRGSIVQLFDIDRVEVLKGPQGTLFGRSAQIGAVAVISRKPEYDYSVEGAYTFGNFDENLIEGAVNAPIVDDTLAVRVAGVYSSREGYIENNAGDDLNGTETAAVRASLRWDPIETVRVDVIGSWQQDTPPGTSFKSGVIPAERGNTNPNDFASLNEFGGFQSNAELGTDRTVWGVTTQVTWDITDAWSLTNIAAYRQFNSEEIFDPDGTAFNILIFSEEASGNQVSEELRLNYDAGGRVRGFIGGNVFLEEGEQRVPLGYDERATLALFSSLAATGQNAAVAGAVGLPANTELFAGDRALAEAFLTGRPEVLNPILDAAFPGFKPFHLEQFSNFADNTSYDIFGEITVDVTERLSLTGGLRWSRDEKETLYSGGVLNGPSVIGQAGVLTGGIPAAPILVADTNNSKVSSGEQTFDDFVWRVVAQYRIEDDLNVYASYARGRRPEVIETEVAGPFFLGFQEIPAEIVDSYEVGAKGLFFGGRLQAEGSVYYYDYENFQTSIVDATTGLTETINAGTADSIGFEMQVVASPLANLDIFATYGFNRGRFDDEDDDGNPLIFGGNQFRLSPDHSFSVGMTYEYEREGLGSVYITPTYTWQSEVFFEDDNAEEVRVFDPADPGQPFYTIPAQSQEAYGLVNVRAGYRSANRDFAIEVYAENLLDEEFIIDAGNTGGAFGVPTFIAGPPRFYGAKVSVQY